MRDFKSDKCLRKHEPLSRMASGISTLPADPNVNAVERWRKPFQNLHIACGQPCGYCGWIHLLPRIGKVVRTSCRIDRFLFRNHESFSEKGSSSLTSVFFCGLDHECTAVDN